MLEDHFAHPQDIEFAIENGRVMILQSRAVTTSARQSDRELKSKDNSNRQVV
jgi:pyruvate,water dikinase